MSRTRYTTINCGMASHTFLVLLMRLLTCAAATATTPPQHSNYSNLQLSDYVIENSELPCITMQFTAKCLSHRELGPAMPSNGPLAQVVAGQQRCGWHRLPQGSGVGQPVSRLFELPQMARMHHPVFLKSSAKPGK
jgi:hypothetical protein